MRRDTAEAVRFADQLERFLDGDDFMVLRDTFVVRLNHVHGRMAIRAYAYSIAAEQPETARRLLDRVGREG